MKKVSQTEQSLINKKRIQQLLGTGEVETLEVVENAASGDSPATVDIHMKIVRQQPGILRSKQQGSPEEEEPAITATRTSRVTKAAGIEGYPEEFLKGMGLL